jgi:hypothetical protein
MHHLPRIFGVLLLAASGLRAGVLELEMSTNQATFFSYALSEDARWVAGGTTTRRIGGPTNQVVPAGQVVLWNAKDGKQEAVLGEHGATVNWMQFSRDGLVLATASGSTATVKVWSPATHSLRHTFKLEEPVLASSTMGSQMVCALSPDGSRLAAVGAVIKPVGISQTSVPATLTVWDTGSGKALWSLTNCGVGTMAFTPDATTLVAFSRNVIWEVVRTFNSSRIADERLMGWEAATGTPRFMSPIPGMNPSHVVIPDAGNAVLALSGDRNTWYDLKSGSVTRDQPILLRRTLHVAALSPEANSLFAIDFSGERMHLINLTNGVGSVVGEFKGYTNKILFAAVSHDLKRLAGTQNNRPVVVDF